MAEEGYYQESRYVCKLCNKKFPCGKSLGGHMRSHVSSVPSPNSSDQSEDKQINDFPVQNTNNNITQDSKKFADLSNGQQSSYVLRENPKKTWRAVDSSRVPSVPQDKICKQCGKGFQSMKALCGHMACHSERDRTIKDDNLSWTSESQKTGFDSCSDTDEADERRMRTRSSSSKNNKRYIRRSFAEKSPFFALASNNSNSNNNNVVVNGGSSSVSEIDGQEQEDVAMCLMLLSRDIGNNHSHNHNNHNNNSVVESSDNNSVVLETKSSSIEMRVGKRDSLNGYIHKQDEERVENKKLKGKMLESDSDSGYFLDECTKPESDVSVDGFFRKHGGFGEYCKNEDYGLSFSGIESRKRKKYYFSEKNPDDNNAKSKYECYNCKKSFKSYQALGGHRPCHKKTDAFHGPRYESGDDSTDYSKRKSSAKKKTVKANNNKNSKGHVCPFCDRVFKNGQALGGHKRSHFIGGHDVNRNQNPVVRPTARDLIDLNVPAPEADGDNERGQFD